MIYGLQLLVNGNFESWVDSTTPSGYNKAESTARESSIVHSGSHSCKVDASTGTRDILQTVSVRGGQRYTISLWWYVESGDGTDVRIRSYWNAGGTPLQDDDDAELRLEDGYFVGSNGVWNKYTAPVTAPATADALNFELQTDAGSVAYWDDLSVSTPMQGLSRVTRTSHLHSCAASHQSARMQAFPLPRSRFFGHELWYTVVKPPSQRLAAWVELGHVGR